MNFHDGCRGSKGRIRLIADVQLQGRLRSMTIAQGHLFFDAGAQRMMALGVTVGSISEEFGAPSFVHSFSPQSAPTANLKGGELSSAPYERALPRAAGPSG